MRKSDWAAKLASSGFLEERETQEGEKTITLKTPVRIYFPAEAANQISSIYDPKFEVGGVLLTKPTIQRGNRVLEAKKVVILKNLSPNADREFFRPHLDQDILNVWRGACISDNECYVPFFLHSHPRIEFDTATDMNRLFHALSPVTTSRPDQDFSELTVIKIGRRDFIIPNALISQSGIIGGRTIIGFYGGGIAPTDFSEYIVKLTGKILQEIWELSSGWFKEDPKRKWILVPLSVFFIILLIRYPRQMMMVIPIVLMLLASQVLALPRQEVEPLPNYFGVMKEELIVSIPRV